MAKTLTTPSSSPTRAPVEVDFFTQGNGYADPRIPVFPPFLYAAHPARWNLIGGKVLPQLRTVALQPGVNQVTRDKSGKYNVATLRANLERDGWQVIPYSMGPGGESYMTAVDTRSGPNLNTSYIPVFAEVFQGSSEMAPDTEAYSAWLQGLIDSGFIKPCPEHVVSKLLERFTAELQTAEARVQSGHASFAPVVEIQRANVASLTKHIGKLSKTRKAAAKKAAVLEME